MFWSSCFLLNCSPSTHLLRSSFCVPWCWPKIEWKLGSNLSYRYQISNRSAVQDCRCWTSSDPHRVAMEKLHASQDICRPQNGTRGSGSADPSWFRAETSGFCDSYRAKLFCSIKEVSLERDTQMEAIPKNQEKNMQIDLTQPSTHMLRSW